MAYLAPSLAALRSEVNASWPARSKRSDGWLGDTAHSARVSDHNPDGKGCVHAIDIDIDGIDAKAVIRAAIGRAGVWYVIHDGVIWSRTYGWRARRYTGPNPHRGHIHISIQGTAAAETATAKWLRAAGGSRPAAAPDNDGGIDWEKRENVPPGSRAVRPGSVGDDVAMLQRYLGVKPANGRFGEKTERAVKRYQRLRGIPQSGHCGPKTWAPILRDLGLD